MTATYLSQSLLAKTAELLRARRPGPEATYRLQFNAGFTFRDAARLVPYLYQLGVTDCYASPYLKARPGSRHGYDIVDHRSLNPEIGSEEDYEAWVHALQEHGLGQILDVVPNHMGIGGGNNWWYDVLESGPASPYAGFFDIDWYPFKPDLHQKVLLPILGEPYGQALEAQQISLRYEAGAFTVHYYEHRLPLGPKTYLKVLNHRLPELEQALGKDALPLMDYQSILTALWHLPGAGETDPGRIAEREREKEVIKRRLAALTESSPDVREFIEKNVALFNGAAGQAYSFDLLDELLNEQSYRLAFWRVAADEINYRRFFDVNDLAALSMERPEVFDATHELIFRLLREGKVTGLRIDHPDGLHDPKQYLERLQQRFVLETARKLFDTLPEFQEVDWKNVEEPLVKAVQSSSGPDAAVFRRPLYVVVEKILGKAEPLPRDWPVHGTTGYEFLNALNGVFIDRAGAAPFNRLYARWIDSSAHPLPLRGRGRGEGVSFRELVYQNKILILQTALSSELHVLANQLDRLSEKHRWYRDFTFNSLRYALREIIACFPVYRSYITSEETIQRRDRVYVETAVARAKRKNPAMSATIFDFVRDMLLLKFPISASEQDWAEQRRFVGKFQQVTAPVMAKGLEDTAFYVYNRLVSLNEVGGNPERFGVPAVVLHRHNLERQARWPYALSATATHDSKRGEDVRARLNVLSELPGDWQKRLNRWHRFNRKRLVRFEDSHAPDRNDEYLLYQTLVGAWPIERGGRVDFADFVERIQAYMQKAIHEAKVHTSWINPNREYDEAVRQFVSAVLDEKENRRFIEDFRQFHQRISHCGLFNSLAQTLLKIAAPGVPDIYQGNELWDFSLVDPDNRRPVDYELRQRLLKALDSGQGDRRLTELARELTLTKEDGRSKLYLTWRALHCRRQHPGLFTTGEYLPAQATGSKREHVFGFVRRRENRWAVAAAPCLLARFLTSAQDLPLGPDFWGDTTLVLPGVEANRRCRNVFTDEVLTPTEHDGHACLPLAAMLAHFPVALLMSLDT